ncbi:MAG: hypothetical protein R3E97_04255 [Candidatus Eisenbacteria bacterium]
MAGRLGAVWTEPSPPFARRRRSVRAILPVGELCRAGAVGGLSAFVALLPALRGLFAMAALSAALVAGGALSGCGLLGGGQPSAADLVGRSGFDWSEVRTEHFTIHYEPGAPGAERADEVGRDAEESLDQILGFLGEPGYDGPLDLFFVPSRERMVSLLGAETNGIAFPETGVLVFLVNDHFRISARHELFHVVAMNRWGTPDLWVNEGGAVCVSEVWYGHPLHGLARHLRESDRWIPLDTLSRKFRGEDDRISYPLAGSFVQFILESWGRDGVRAAWDGGTKELSRFTGLSLEQLEEGWVAAVEEASADGIEYP